MSTEPENPANEPGKRERIRAAFALPDLKLSVPPIPGYKLYWFRGEPGRLARAERAGYEYVYSNEVDVNNFDLAGDAFKDGNTDMGERVSLPAQDGVGEDGQYLRLYLMKIKEEYWLEDQAEYEKKRIDPIVAALKAGTTGAGEQGETTGDVAQRYIPRRAAPLPEMFTRKPRK